MGIGEIVQKRAIFFDRDGVLNQAIVRVGKPYPPANLNELVIPEEVPVVLHALKKAGFLLIGATNQPDVARGTTQKTMVEAINAQLLAALPLDEILVCYHDDADGCSCRKPEPGLLLQAAERYHIDLHASFMVGDRWKDIDAGRKAGCCTVWLDAGYAERAPNPPADYTVQTLMDMLASCFPSSMPH